MRAGNESSVLASRAKELEQNMKKDVVHRELENRPELSEMKERGLLSGRGAVGMIVRPWHEQHAGRHGQHAGAEHEEGCSERVLRV